MARSANKINLGLLEDIVEQIEKDGPLSTLGELHKKIAIIYNKRKNVALKSISHTTVNLKLKKLNIITKTKPGKRGGGGLAKGTKTGDVVFLPLTDWVKSIVEVGLHVGNEVESRFVLSFDKRNWIVAIERKGHPPIGKKFFGNFRTMFPNLSELGIDINKVIPNIVSELSSRLNINSSIDFDNKDLNSKGKAIDELFKVSFLSPLYHDVRDRLMKR